MSRKIRDLSDGGSWSRSAGRNKYLLTVINSKIVRIEHFDSGNARTNWSAMVVVVVVEVQERVDGALGKDRD